MRSWYRYLLTATCALCSLIVFSSQQAQAQKRADFDGDGQTDVSIWNPQESRWYILLSSQGNALAVEQDGSNYCMGDVAVPGDYDGDGKTDIAFYRPSEASWYITQSSNNSKQLVNFGGGDPVQADYDGDHRTDPAFFNALDGTWRILNSSDGSVAVRQWGARDDVPVPGDYDGDGRSDMAVYRQGESNWYVLRSSGGASVQQWGGDDDSLVPADYDGDGMTDYAVFRNQEGNWYIRMSGGGASVRNWGGWIQQGNAFTRDQLVPGDYDGDGKDDIAVYRYNEGNWYILGSAGGTKLLSLFGDIPVPSTYLPDYVITDPICDL